MDYSAFCEALGSDFIFKLGFSFGTVMGFLFALLVSGILACIFDFIARFKIKKEAK